MAGVQLLIRRLLLGYVDLVSVFDPSSETFLLLL